MDINPDASGEQEGKQAEKRGNENLSPKDCPQRSRVDANAGLADIAGDLGRGLGGIVEGVGGLFSGLARAGLEAAAGAAGEDRAPRREEESSGAADRDCDRGMQRSSDHRDER